MSLQLPLCLPYPKKYRQLSGNHRPRLQILPSYAYLKQSEAPEGVRMSQDSDLPAEGYRLRVLEDSIHLDYADEPGRFYALRSLALIFTQPELPCFEIEDAPALSHRCFMLDISRDRVPKLETLYTIIDLCADLKINELQLYNEHCFSYAGHAKVWAHASPYTAEDIEAIQSYAQDRCITLIANQNSYGHMERWLCYPEYRHLAETPDGFTDPWNVFRAKPSTLCPHLPGTEALIENIFGQYFPLFDAEMVNVGGDEPWEHCMGQSAARASEVGKGKIYRDYILKLHRMLTKQGKQMQMWADILNTYPECIADIPSDIVLLEWGYEVDHPFIERAQRLQSLERRFYLCTGTSSWNSIASRWSIARTNCCNAVSAAIEYGARGSMLTDWGDNGHWQQLPTSFPALVLFANLSWNGSDLADSAITQWLSQHVFSDPGHAEALIELSKIASSNHFLCMNATIPAVSIMPDLWPYYTLWDGKRARFDLSPEIATVESIIAKLATGDLDGWGRDISWTAELLHHALQHLQVLEGMKAESWEEIRNHPEGRILQQRLERLIIEYGSLWELRSRPGGMSTSIQRFLDLLEHYSV